MTVAVNGGAPETAHKIMKGTWRYALRDLATGTHTALVTTTEATYGTGGTRPLINTSVLPAGSPRRVTVAVPEPPRPSLTSYSCQPE